MKVHINGKNLFETHVYSLQCIKLERLIEENSIEAVPLDLENVKSIHDGFFKNSFRIKLLEKSSDLVKAFLFLYREKEIGYAFVLFRDAEDQICKVQTAEPYLSQIEVFQEYRGCGYAKKILSWLAKYLMDAGFNTLTLVCNPKNIPAMNLYKKLGFKESRELKYLRIAKYNIPRIII